MWRRFYQNLAIFYPIIVAKFNFRRGKSEKQPFSWILQDKIAKKWRKKFGVTFDSGFKWFLTPLSVCLSVAPLFPFFFQFTSLSILVSPFYSGQRLLFFSSDWHRRHLDHFSRRLPYLDSALDGFLQFRRRAVLRIRLDYFIRRIFTHFFAQPFRCDSF